MASLGAHWFAEGLRREHAAKREAAWHEDPTVAGAIRTVLTNYMGNINPTYKPEAEAFLREKNKPTLEDLDFFVRSLGQGMNPQGALYHAMMMELPAELRARQKYNSTLSVHIGEGLEAACINAVERFKVKELSYCIRSLLESYLRWHPLATHKDPVEAFLKEKAGVDITVADVVKLLGAEEFKLNPAGALYNILMHKLPASLARIPGWEGKGAEIMDKLSTVYYACEQATQRFNAAPPEVRGRAGSTVAGGVYELQPRRGSTIGVPGGAHAFLAGEGESAAGGSAAASSKPVEEGGAASSGPQ